MDRAKHEQGRSDEDAPGEVHAAVDLQLPRPSRRFAALTTSALALPGIAGTAGAETPIDRASGSYAFSYYFEDDLSVNKILPGTGSRERYEVLTHQLRFDLPVTQRSDVGVQLLYEEMSGASPWFVQAGPTSGEPLQVMSGATIEDERFDMTIDADFYLDDGKDTIAAGISTENDYFSVHGGLAAERHYNDKNTTLSLAGAFSYDWIDATDPEFSNTRPQNTKKKWAIDLFGGFSQILTRSTTGQITVNYKHSEGYLSDPYKAIQDLSQSGLLADARPGEKDQVSILGRLRQHVEPLNASIHFDYRFYADTFKITSHTVDIAWVQTLFDVLYITPSVRYYSQSKAEFYDTVLPVGVIPQERSSDFRLSPYGAISARLKLELVLEELFRYDSPRWIQAVGVTEGMDLIAALSYERYVSDGNYGLVSVSEQDEAPGLVKFQIVAFTLTGRF